MEAFTAVVVNSVSFRPDGRRGALAGFGHVEIWDVSTRTRSVDLPGHTKWVYCVFFRWLRKAQVHALQPVLAFP